MRGMPRLDGRGRITDTGAELVADCPLVPMKRQPQSLRRSAGNTGASGKTDKLGAAAPPVGGV